VQAQFQVLATWIDRLEEIHYLAIEPEHSRAEEEKLQALVDAARDVSRKKQLYEAKFGLQLTARGIASESLVQREPRH
jgi:hypothetical protein